MKKSIFFIAAILALSCQKTAVTDENAWQKDSNLRVPVLMNSVATLDSPALKSVRKGAISGNVMNDLDIGVIAVAEKDSEKNPVVWGPDVSGTVLIDNRMVTTSETGAIVFSPKVYYPYNNQYAFNFYSYYPYTNDDGETAVYTDGAYRITYKLGNTDILWASATAVDYLGMPGFNAAYCRAVKRDGVESEYYPKLIYSHKLTALAFRIVGKDATIEDYDIKIKGVHIHNTPTSATLCVADRNGAASGIITGSTTLGTIGFDDLDVKPLGTQSDICTIMAMPAEFYNGDIVISVEGTTEANPLPIMIGRNDGTTKYEAGYIYYFTITINNPEEVSIVETGLSEWVPGENPTEGIEI